MGLNCSHDAWHGAYSSFHSWRSALARVAGLPPLELMEGFYDAGTVLQDPFYLINARAARNGDTLHTVDGRITNSLPIMWACLKPSPLHLLLRHSDCDGEISAEDCGPIADSLERLIPMLDDSGGGHIAARGGMRAVTQQFISGLRAAAAAGEPLDFH